MHDRKTIAVIFGGRSPEHDVSIITAHVPIMPSLRAMGHQVVPVYIAKSGLWYSEMEMNDLAYFKQPDFEDKLARRRPLHLSFEGGLTLVHPGLFSRSLSIDIVFPGMHGTLGEDGSLMGLLRMANVPFVGCDLFASTVAMDKALTKQVISAERVPVVPYVWFTKHEWEHRAPDLRRRISRLTWPLFVKPVHLGSSIAIAKVKDDAALETAVEVALHYDDKVLVEESVENLIEVTLPIMGNNELRLAAIERPLNKTEFFDFNDKYLAGASKTQGVNSAYSEIPADIEPDLAQQVQALGTKVYKALGCSGIARVDFLIDGRRNQVFVNEVNTLPGSLYHHNWKKAGISSIALVATLLALAEERFADQQKLTRAFKSDVLARLDGAKA